MKQWFFYGLLRIYPPKPATKAEQALYRDTFSLIHGWGAVGGMQDYHPWGPNMGMCLEGLVNGLYGSCKGWEVNLCPNERNGLETALRASVVGGKLCQTLQTWPPWAKWHFCKLLQSFHHLGAKATEVSMNLNFTILTVLVNFARKRNFSKVDKFLDPFFGEVVHFVKLYILYHLRGRRRGKNRWRGKLKV